MGIVYMYRRYCPYVLEVLSICTGGTTPPLLPVFLSCRPNHTPYFCQVSIHPVETPPYVSYPPLQPPMVRLTLRIQSSSPTGAQDPRGSGWAGCLLGEVWPWSSSRANATPGWFPLCLTGGCSTGSGLLRRVLTSLASHVVSALDEDSLSLVVGFFSRIRYPWVTGRLPSCLGERGSRNRPWQLILKHPHHLHSGYHVHHRIQHRDNQPSPG